jgi:TolB-like protein
MLDKPADTGAEIGSQPIVAVLRFANETGDAAQIPLVDGFAEEIINGLARFGTVTVLARNSSFTLPFGRRQDWANVRLQLGADYLVEGAVRDADGRLRVSVNLIDAATLVQLWGERYDAESGSVFSIQQDIVERIIGQLVTRLEDVAASRVLQKPAASLAAYELMLRGVALLRGNDPADYGPAHQLLEAAAAKDPSSGLILAHMAFARVMLVGFGRAKREDLDAILPVATRATILSPDQPAAYRVLSFVQMYRHEYGAAEHHLRRAIDLNPYDPENAEQMGYLLVLRGRPQEALQWMDRACRLSPIHPTWYEHDRSFALYQLGDYRAAASQIELSPLPPAWMQTWLAACYAQMGDMETARRHAAHITEIDPAFSAEVFASRNGATFEHDADRKHFADGVYLALGMAGENNGSALPV